MFLCPGCNQPHHVVRAPGKWTWNQDAERPTLTPSVLVTGLQTIREATGKWTGEWFRDAKGNPIPMRCHSFVTDGRIRFLSDCTHALAGQTVDLPDWVDH